MRYFDYDIWRAHQFFGIFALTTIFLISFWRNHGWILTVSFAYTLASALFMFQGPSTWGQLQPRIDVSSASSFAQLILLMVVIWGLSKQGMKWLFRAVEILMLADCILVLTLGYGMFNAYSCDNAMIAMAFPIMVWKHRSDHDVWLWGKVFLVIASLVFGHGSTAWIVVIAGLLAYGHANKSTKFSWLVIPMLALAIAVEPRGLIHYTTRIQEWQRFMTWWWENANIWLGTGTATYIWLGPGITVAQMDKGANEIMIMMHNEYLQALFEQGIIGCIIYSVLAWKCIKYSIKTPWLFASLVSIAVCSIAYYPFRFLLSQIFIFAIIRSSMDEQLSQHRQSH